MSVGKFGGIQGDRHESWQGATRWTPRRTFGWNASDATPWDAMEERLPFLSVFYHALCWQGCAISKLETHWLCNRCYCTGWYIHGLVSKATALGSAGPEVTCWLGPATRCSGCRCSTRCGDEALTKFDNQSLVFGQGWSVSSHGKRL